jgi:large subunit ribosomal protein L17
MRHGVRAQRLSRPTDARAALLAGCVRNLVVHGRIRTTLAKAKDAQRLADRLVTWGKDGSVHARRQALRVLRDRTLVKRLFADIAPRFADARGGYTRVVRLGIRRGDGASLALLAFTRLPEAAAARPKAQAAAAPAGREAPAPAAEPKAPRRLLEGLRRLLGRRGQKGREAT